MRNDVPTIVGSRAISLCLGHSLGMYRGSIRHGCDHPRWMARLFLPDALPPRPEVQALEPAAGAVPHGAPILERNLS